MKKIIKLSIITFIIIILILALDTAIAKIFNKSPIFKVTKYYNGGNLYSKEKGILVYTYTYTDGTKKTVFRWEDSNIPNGYIAVFNRWCR